MILLLCEGSRNTGSFVEVAAAGVLGAGDVAILAERDMFARRTAALHVGVCRRCQGADETRRGASWRPLTHGSIVGVSPRSDETVARRQAATGLPPRGPLVGQAELDGRSAEVTRSPFL